MDVCTDRPSDTPKFQFIRSSPGEAGDDLITLKYVMQVKPTHEMHQHVAHQDSLCSRYPDAKTHSHSCQFSTVTRRSRLKLHQSVDMLAIQHDLLSPINLLSMISAL